MVPVGNRDLFHELIKPTKVELQIWFGKDWENCSHSLPTFCGLVADLQFTTIGALCAPRIELGSKSNN